MNNLALKIEPIAEESMMDRIKRSLRAEFGPDSVIEPKGGAPLRIVSGPKLKNAKLVCDHEKVSGPFYAGCLKCEPWLSEACGFCSATRWRCCC